jgi:hypothetical protein
MSVSTPAGLLAGMPHTFRSPLRAARTSATAASKPAWSRTRSPAASVLVNTPPDVQPGGDALRGGGWITVPDRDHGHEGVRARGGGPPRLQRRDRVAPGAWLRLRRRRADRGRSPGQVRGRSDRVRTSGRGRNRDRRRRRDRAEARARHPARRGRGAPRVELLQSMRPTTSILQSAPTLTTTSSSRARRRVVLRCRSYLEYGTWTSDSIGKCLRLSVTRCARTCSAVAAIRASASPVLWLLP